MEEAFVLYPAPHVILVVSTAYGAQTGLHILLVFFKGHHFNMYGERPICFVVADLPLAGKHEGVLKGLCEELRRLQWVAAEKRGEHQRVILPNQVIKSRFGGLSFSNGRVISPGSR